MRLTPLSTSQSDENSSEKERCSILDQLRDLKLNTTHMDSVSIETTGREKYFLRKVKNYKLIMTEGKKLNYPTGNIIDGSDLLLDWEGSVGGI